MDKSISVYKVGLLFFFQQFVTRAVRVVDLITNLDMAAFQAQGGLFTFINRLEVIGKASVYQVHMYFSHLHHMICFSPTKKCTVFMLVHILKSIYFQLLMKVNIYQRMTKKKLRNFLISLF